MEEPTRRPEARPETIAQKQVRLFGGGRDTGRIEAFSDGVFAIALTLLVLDLRVPELHGRTVWAAIVALWPQFLGYVLSFLIIAINWVFHHRKFRAIIRYDTRLIWINLAFLFFVALVPFPTSLLSEYAPDPAAVSLYAASVAILGLLATVLWQYAHRKGFLSPAVDRDLARFTTVNNLVVPVVFVASIPIALFWNAEIAMFFWIANWPVSIVVDRVWGHRAAGPDPDGEPLKD
ncbi:TMEM175 family protein [Pseudolysinimonas sp.]|uniref:TMEM175 family protein n=1 Tax=Pseudolysinimonas sp. TaxID=2680009 RepID=UPI003F7EE5BF